MHAREQSQSPDSRHFKVQRCLGPRIPRLPSWSRTRTAPTIVGAESHPPGTIGGPDSGPLNGKTQLGCPSGLHGLSYKPRVGAKALAQVLLQSCLLPLSHHVQCLSNYLWHLCQHLNQHCRHRHQHWQPLRQCPGLQRCQCSGHDANSGLGTDCGTGYSTSPY